MPAAPKKKTLRSRLRDVFRTLLPRTWALRAQLRRVHRHYRPRVAQAKGDEREMLIQEHMHEWADVEEEIESIETQRLIRRARKYYIVIPEKPWRSDDKEDENWKYGWVSDTWHLTPAGVASLRRQIEEARARRRAAWEAWAKILGGLITGFVALISVLALALRR